MRTALEWFSEIEDEDIRQSAIDNTQKSMLGNYYRRLSSALQESFIWSNTPQGHDLWEEVFEEQRRKELSA